MPFYNRISKKEKERVKSMSEALDGERGERREAIGDHFILSLG